MLENILLILIPIGFIVMLLLYVEKAHGGIQGLKDYLLFTFNRRKWEEKNFPSPWKTEDYNRRLTMNRIKRYRKKGRRLNR